MRNWLNGLRGSEKGAVLPIVLVLLLVGVLITLPSLRYVSTSLNAGETIEENVRGLYAAEAGIEDAIWRLNNESLQDELSKGAITYTLKDADGKDAQINGMTVALDLQFVPFIDEDKVLRVGTHQDWLTIEGQCTEVTQGDWVYVLTIIDDHSPKNYNVSWLAIDLPGGLDYNAALGVTGNITTGAPDVSGNPENGIRLVWSGHPLFTIQDATNHEPYTYTLGFHLTEIPPYLTDSTPDGVISMYVQDELKFVTSAWPFVITATARNTSGEQAKITAGVWTSDGDVYIRDWEITP